MTALVIQDPETVREIMRLSRVLGISPQEVVREALFEFVERHAQSESQKARRIGCV